MAFAVSQDTPARPKSTHDLNFSRSTLHEMRGAVLTRSGCTPATSKPPGKSMGFSNKNHYRIVFKDVGTPVFQITSVKVLFKVLADIMTALEILHRAGWIHRDLSPSNIYAHDGDGKLSDLEYAKKHTDDSKHEVRTGTAQFMACEVEIGRFHAAVFPFRANGLHDMESCLWIAIWMIFYSTSSVLDKPPAPGTDTSEQLQAAYAIVYENRSFSMAERNTTLKIGFQTLNPNVAFILPSLIKVRDSLAHHRDIVAEALDEGTATVQNVHSLYTSVYSSVRTAFQKISDEAPQEHYLHFITRGPSPERKGRDDAPEPSRANEKTDDIDKALQVVDKVPPTKRRRQ